MSLVTPDKEEKKQWSFDVPKGQKVLRQLKKKDFEKPGIEYKFKMDVAFKFVQ